ncbi:MAG: GGDEF domain-containing protein [Ilumatobacteraceae bacterium]
MSHPAAGPAPEATTDSTTSTTTSITTASRRTMLLAVVLIVASAGSLVAGGLLDATPPHAELAWWSIALMAIAAEFMEFNVEFRREVYAFTFSEVPLVLGLFLAHPRDLVIGRLAGELIYLVVRGRQPARKVVLNLASFLAEMTMLLAVYRVMGGAHAVGDPLEWLRALTAVAAAMLIGYLVVFQVVQWHGAPVDLPSILLIGGLTIPVNTSFALVIGVLIVDRPWATFLLLGVAAFLLLAYRSYTNLRQRFESLSLLYDFTRLVSGAQRPDAVLEAMLAQAKDLLRAERAEIWLREDDDSMLQLRVDDAGRSSDRLPAAAAGSMQTWFGRHREATIIGEATTGHPAREVLAHLGARDGIVAPITESGQVVGLVAVVNRLGEVNRFQESDRTMFATLANHASVALENGRLIDRLHHEARLREHEALHDALTALPNRVKFADRLRDELHVVHGTGRPLAVALMDLDGFKEVNDTLGHHAGDLVLVEVARRLAYAASDTALVARLGGDEFAILVDHDITHPRLESLARRIRDELNRPFAVDGVQVDVNGSIGFALAPADATDAPTLMQRADVAMYSAKAGHGNGVAFYDALRDEHSPRRLRLATDLRSAITADQLALVFQPKARATDGSVVGFEALVRWHHPEFGQVFPDEFIPIAERTGSINELTVWVLRHATEQAVRWRDTGHDWTIAVNVAMRNLLDNDFVAIVERTLATTRCEATRLTLEITETNVMTDTARTVEVLQRLDRLGVRLSVDDFGTGYSSLSYLQQLPVVELKIDRFFVQDMVRDEGAEAIVRSVLDLAANLSLHVVAEGVEDRRRGIGCASWAAGTSRAITSPARCRPTWSSSGTSIVSPPNTPSAATTH